MNKGRLLILLGSILLMIGGFLPWISVPDLFGLSDPAFEGIEIGWEGDGLVTASIGLIIALIYLFYGGLSRRWLTLTGVILTALVAIVVTLDFLRIIEISPEVGFIAATDIGIHLTLVGSTLAFIGCLLQPRFVNRTSTSM